MGIREKQAEERFDVNHWPHQFTKKGPEVQIGEVDQDPIFAVPMVCTRCTVEWLNGKDPRPADPCPARTKKTELKRLFS